MNRTASVPGAGRIRLLTGIFILGVCLLAVRLGVMQIAYGSYYQDLAEDQHRFFSRLTPFRGEIKITDKGSTDSFPVATNIQTPLVYAVPKDVVDPLATSRVLASLIHVPEAEILEKVTNTSKGYVPIKRRLTTEEKEKVLAAKLSGILIDEETLRYYPERQLLSHVVGFMGYKDDGALRTGLYGLERSYQNILGGVPGEIKANRAAGGGWLFSGGQDFTPAQNGDQMLLTIDRSVQLAAENILSKTVEEHQADGGCVVIMEPRTGAILAMASNPTFNPNEYGKVEDQSVFTNSCTMASYEPGSVFKAITLAGAVDQGVLTPDSVFTDPGQIEIDGYTIKNSDNKSHGVQTMTQVLEESLNTGAIYAKDKLGNERFLSYVKKFGFGNQSGIDLPESGGNISNLKGNIAVNYATASFGQGILVTPLQMVRSYAVLANGGSLPKPYVVESRVTSDGKTITTKPEVTPGIISKEAASSTAAMLVSVVESGHGKRAGVPGYYVAGKTGTAQVARKDGRGYDPDNNIGTFVGFAPVEDPKFVMLVRINHPRDVKFAESTAAPAFGQLAQFLLSYYNVPPTREIPK